MNHPLPIESNVVLSAGNIYHYHHAALALDRAHLLKTYICSFAGGFFPEPFIRFLPEPRRKKIAARQLDGIDQNKVLAIPIPEIVARSLRGLRLISPVYADALFSWGFDLATKNRIDNCRVFHFVNTLGLQTARKLKERGAVLICDARTEHSEYQNRILSQEYQKLGLEYFGIDLPYQSRKVGEYSIADFIIVPSEYAARTFIDAGIAPEKLRVVPYGVETNLFSEAGLIDEMDERRSSEFRILFVGQLTIRKGIHYLLQAFSLLKIPNCKLTLAGVMDPLAKPIIEPFLALPNIEYLGHLPQASLRQLYRNSAVFVLPSLSDSYGLVTLEAMASGLPVIVSQNTGSKEAVRDGKDGYIVPICDVGALVERLTNLYENQRQRSEMGKSARNQAQRFNWTQYGDLLLKVYSSISREGSL